MIQATLSAATAAALLVAVPSPGTSQSLFVCEDEGRSFVFAGEEGAPGCSEVAPGGRDLGLTAAQPDMDAIVRALNAQSARISRLEQLLLGARSQPSRRPAIRPTTDPFDTQGRTRDLGQDVERRLDELGR